MGISNQTSFSYPQTFHSVGISSKTSFSYPQTFHVVAGGFQQKRTAPPDVDAAETVRFSWKVVEPQGQREHDVRVSR